MNLDPTALIVAYSTAWLLGFILFVLLWIFIIRTAVLSALRKHHAETQAERRTAAARGLTQ